VDLDMHVVSAAPAIVQPEEIAALVHFLAADDCAMISGVAVPLDGGITAGERRPDRGHDGGEGSQGHVNPSVPEHPTPLGKAPNALSKRAGPRGASVEVERGADGVAEHLLLVIEQYPNVLS
jgi:hypothetical protein